jgi:hypothetical protein
MFGGQDGIVKLLKKLFLVTENVKSLSKLHKTTTLGTSHMLVPTVVIFPHKYHSWGNSLQIAQKVL